MEGVNTVIKKLLLIVYHGDSPVCLEGFPKDCKRSSDKKGAMHIMPSVPVTMTEDEHAHFLNKYPTLKLKVKIVAVKKVNEEEVKVEDKKPEKKDEVKKEGDSIESPSHTEVEEKKDTGKNTKKKKK